MNSLVNKVSTILPIFTLGIRAKIKAKIEHYFLETAKSLIPPNSNLHTVQKQFLSDLGPIVALESLALSKFLASLILVIGRLLIAWKRVDYSYTTILSIKNILDTACCFQ